MVQWSRHPATTFSRIFPHVSPIQGQLQPPYDSGTAGPTVALARQGRKVPTKGIIKMFKKNCILALLLILACSVIGQAEGQIFPLVLSGRLAGGYSWDSSFRASACTMTLTTVQTDPYRIGYQRVICPGGSFTREELRLLSPDGTLLASAQLPASHSGGTRTCPGIPGDVTALITDTALP